MTDENTRASQLGKLLDTKGPDSGDTAYLRSVADELGANGTDEGAAHSHNLQAIADKIDRASLQPSVVEAGTVSDVFIDRTDTALAPTTQGTDSGLAQKLTELLAEYETPHDRPRAKVALAIGYWVVSKRSDVLTALRTDRRGGR